MGSRTAVNTYDGLQRLTGAVESPGNSFTYRYDLAGNRTGVSINGAAAAGTSYDAADQVQGWSYDQAGNLTNDGTTSYSYNALNRLTTTIGAQTSSYSYNGDGTLVGQTTNGAGTSYVQDLAAGQSQILVAATSLTSTDYLYGDGSERLAASTGNTRTWYGTDGQGSVRQTLDDSANVLGTQSYDPFGRPETGSTLVSSFGYTGELQNSSTGAEYLRARWYQPGTGQLLGVDPLVASTGQPYSYANDNPVNGSDPSGLAPTQDEIDRLLQHVLDTGTQIVTPGSGTPPGNQPWPYFIGTQVHNRIASYYISQNPASRVFTNNIPMTTILKALESSADPTALSAMQLALRPDIFDATYRRVYEIKPYTAFIAAQIQLNVYIAAFHAAHVYMVTPGSSNAPGTSGIVSAPGGYAVFASPAPGIILYRKFNGMYKPAPAQNAVCSSTQAAQALVTVVVTVFGLLIQLIPSPGSSGSPAFA